MRPESGELSRVKKESFPGPIHDGMSGLQRSGLEERCLSSGSQPF